MAYIEDTEQLEARLEQGLGDVYEGGLFSLRQDLRLRLRGVCGVASIATQFVLHEQGIQSELVLSQPKLPFDEAADHVFVLVDGETIIDPSYSQFIEYAGVTPHDVARGAAPEDTYPQRKIEQFNTSEAGGIARVLAGASLRAMEVGVVPFDHFDRRLFARPELEGMSEDEIAAHFTAIWNPENFTEYDPSRLTVHYGRQLGWYAVARNAGLIA